MIAGPSPSRLYFCSFRFVAFLLYWSLSLFSIFIAPTLFDIKNKSKRTRFPFFFSPASDRQEALSVLYSCKGFLFHFFLSFPICVESVSDWKKKLLSFQLTCELTFSLSWIARDIARLWELLRTLRDGGYDRHESLVKQRGSGGVCLSIRGVSHYLRVSTTAVVSDNNSRKLAFQTLSIKQRSLLPLQMDTVRICVCIQSKY